MAEKSAKVKRYLFVCAHDVGRSPTAANMASLMAKRVGMNLYSAHLAGGIQYDLSESTKKYHAGVDFGKYDRIFVMEEYMSDLLTKKYQISLKKIVCLDIPDVYQRGDSELVGILEEKLDEWIK